MKIDARGKNCPLPVIETKKAMEQCRETNLEIWVDNEIAVQNLYKLAQQKGVQIIDRKESENCYVVTLINKPIQPKQPPKTEQNTIVVLSSETMGKGDEVLGRLLMKGFVYALTETEQLPNTILLYNSGAKLAVHGAETVPDLQLMEEQGVAVLVCGTCLNHYGLSEQLAVGSVTNMYHITEILAQASKVIAP